jgi:ChrR Cupin-like domain
MKRADHRFRALYDRQVKWREGAANKLLTLPRGVQVKIFSHDPATKRIDMKVKFPKGYVEPAHTHKSWHSILVTKGRMCVAGKDLRPGDYVFGWDTLHGPYEYPDGCEVFVVFMGAGTQHDWKEDSLLRHRTKWRARTTAGKRAVAKADAARRRALASKVVTRKGSTARRGAAGKRRARR